MSTDKLIVESNRAFREGHYRASHRLAVAAFDAGMNDEQIDWFALRMEQLERVDPVLMDNAGDGET